MDSKRLKCIDVFVNGKNDLLEVSVVKHCSSPLYVNIAKAMLVERLSRSFPELTFHISVARIYE